MMLCGIRRFLARERAISGIKRVDIFNRLLDVRLLSTNKKQVSSALPQQKEDPESVSPQGPSTQHEVPLLHYAGLGLISYGAIYMSMLGFSYIGLEMNFLSCQMVGISPDACVDQVSNYITLMPHFFKIFFPPLNF